MLELESQVAVLELGENFMRLSDLVAVLERSSEVSWQAEHRLQQQVAN